MHLDQLIIKNFRSIKDETINFDNNFQILVGVNEAGKSNILKALSLINQEAKVSVDDIRDPAHNEDAVEEAYVEFIFNLNAPEIKDILNSINNVILANQTVSTPFLVINKIPYTIEDLVKFKQKISYIVNIKNSKRSFNIPISSVLEKFSVTIGDEWKKIKTNAVYTFTQNNQPITLKHYYIVNTNDYNDIPEQYLETLNTDDIIELLNDNISIIIEENHFPKCINWFYHEENLLPGKINLKMFLENPDICVPLKNMFALAGFSDTTKTLIEAQEKSNGIRNIFKKISENTTSHMKKVWPEWKNLKVTISQNGDFIEAGIEDEYNMYSLIRRSDGFKRFFTFLLMISAQNKTERLKNNIIIMDEPDIGLHPTGIQYLCEELKKIGKNNIVMISTHSIFMIDKEVIDRHLIVKKDKEITRIEKISSSDTTDEEVVYKALEYSVYELLKPKNIIFEGWKDKKIFTNYNKKLDTTIGLLHAYGVKDVPRIVSLCENFNRTYIIITDSDKPAKEKQTVFGKNGKWLCYDDINNINAITTEDFISNKLINKAIKDCLSSIGIDTKIIIPEELENGKIAFIEKEIDKIGNLSSYKKKILEDIKNHISENAKNSDLHENYQLVVDTILEKINQD